MKCPNCGENITTTSCTKCGYSFTQAGNATAGVKGKTVYHFTYHPQKPTVQHSFYVTGEPMAINTQPVVEPEKKVNEHKYLGIRIFALVIMLLSICTLITLTFGAVLQFVTVGTNAVPDVGYGSLWEILITTLTSQSDVKVFGILPALFNGEGGALYNMSVYVFVLCTLLGVGYALAAHISKDKAPTRVRRSLFFLGFGAFFYAFALALLLRKGVLNAGNLLKLNVFSIFGFHFDIFSLVLGIACLALSFILFIHRHVGKDE